MQCIIAKTHVIPHHDIGAILDIMLKILQG